MKLRGSSHESRNFEANGGSSPTSDSPGAAGMSAAAYPHRIPEEMPMERLTSICMSDRAVLAGIRWRISA
jgi:hypothetical protein